MNVEVLLMVMFFSTIFTVVYQRRHLLMVLLSLESVMLVLILFFLWQLSKPCYTDSFVFIIILTLGAIEASLGLSLLVTMTRKAGSDLAAIMTGSKC
uniref:NADH-ubiquinone oxidoreductase chain 4L n=1 Tax=Auchenoplax crinita TaxID=397536 RepID=G8XXL5_AUCCR|nr:NADH dehydrogenase subunit 4L [Auchenoplax crinita]